MTDDLIGRAEAQTAIQFAAKRYMVAHEAHGEGQVVWSDNLINVTDAMNVLRDLPSAQPERPTGEWIQKPRYEDDEYPDAQPNLKCPFCGYEIGWCDMGNYCARCGADLKGGAV